MIFVDTNILIDISNDNPVWAEWSLAALGEAHGRGPLFINAVIYAEFATAFDDEVNCAAELDRFDLVLAEIPAPAAFHAAQAFRRYRQSGGARGSVFPDFFIGAHASVLGASVLTRDVRRYRTYFPEVALIAPEAT